MNRTEHWEQAEVALVEAEDAVDLNVERYHLAKAQVHATLAAAPVDYGSDGSV